MVVLWEVLWIDSKKDKMMRKKIRLGVNIDHVATVRNARGECYPNPIEAALCAEQAGADNITFHLREDRRHIKDRDVELLKETISIPLNFEMAATSEMMAIATKIKPEAVTLVPEHRQELTTEGGLNLAAHSRNLQDKVHALKEQGILVVLFVNPFIADLDQAKALGADAIECHTGDFCRNLLKTRKSVERKMLIEELAAVTEHGSSIGLQVHVGHGLNYQNAHWMQCLSVVEEANIGHAIVSKALFIGFREAVREMKDLLNNPKEKP